MPGARSFVGATGGCTFSWCANLSDSALNGTWTIAAVHSSTEFTFDVTTGNVATTSDPTGTIADPQVTCGCSGGGKFWATAGGTVTNNWVHDNGFVGIWADTDNSGFNISGNYIDNNWAEGIIYEVSYNASITDNGFVDNAWGQGPSPALGGFPDPGLYISESGSDSRVSGAYGASFSISSNAFVDNWGGVAIYENSNRACGITNDSMCTLIGTEHLHLVVVRLQHPEREDHQHSGLRRQLPVEGAEHLGEQQPVRLHAERHRCRLRQLEHVRLQRPVQ